MCRLSSKTRRSRYQTSWHGLKPAIIIAIAFVLIVGVSVTSISAQFQTDIPAWVKGVANFWVEGNISDSEFGESLSFLIEQNIIQVEMPETDDYQKINTIRNLEVENKKLEAENKKLKNDVSILEAENKRLNLTIDNLLFTPPDLSYPEIPSFYEIRYDVDDVLNIGGLTIDLHSFGFMEPKPDEFSIDMDIRYTRGGSAVEFEVTQVRVKTDNNFTYEADKTQFLRFNGFYSEDDTNRGIVRVDDVQRELESNFEILIFVREIERGYYVQDYIFTFPYTLD